jgi:hypothetical protein
VDEILPRFPIIPPSMRSQPETLDPPVRGDAAICAEEGNCGRHVGDAYSAAGEWHWPLFFLVEIFRWSGQEFQVPV